MNYLEKLQCKHGNFHVHMVPKDAIVTLDLSLTYYVSLATRTPPPLP